jgi:hypothetical protein
MRLAILVLIPAMLSGCATRIAYSPKQKCAMDEMVLQGIQHSDSSAMAYNWQTRSVVTASGNTESVSCRVPANDQEKAEAQAINRSLGPIHEYNSGIGGKNLLVGIGYLFYIVPGVGAKLYYDKKHDEALAQSNLLLREPASVPEAKQ